MSARPSMRTPRGAPPPTPRGGSATPRGRATPRGSSTPRGFGSATPSGSVSSWSSGGNLCEIRERLQPRAGSISIMGRCHKAPRTLEQDYELTSRVLGTGYNGSVRMAKARRGSAKETVAVKTFKLRGLKPKKKAQLQTEIEVFLAMDHPHVARLHDVYETENSLHLVMEC